MVLRGHRRVSANETSRLSRDVPDDTVLPFTVESLDVRGRVVRLGPQLDTLLTRHAYPQEVSLLLAEAVALTALLGTSLKFEGRFLLQTTGDGAVPMLVVDFEAPDRIRAYASFDATRLQAAIDAGKTAPHELLGRGHLALTVDQGAGMNRYQGLVPLDGSTLSEIAHSYFVQSEQIPTLIRLAVTPSVSTQDGAFRSGWRAGGLMLQFLPVSPERQKMADFAPGDAPEGYQHHEHDEDDAWTTARALAETVTHDELIDPDLSPEALLYRLFHEQGVRVFDPTPVNAFCRCSNERVGALLKTFTPEEKAHMVVDGAVRITCEFCSRSYTFSADAIKD